MDIKKLGMKLAETTVPNMNGYSAFILWSLFVTGEDPRYAKTERLEILWARWNIEAPDAVQAMVEKYAKEAEEKKEYQRPTMSSVRMMPHPGI